MCFASVFSYCWILFTWRPHQHSSWLSLWVSSFLFLSILIELHMILSNFHGHFKVAIEVFAKLELLLLCRIFKYGHFAFANCSWGELGNDSLHIGKDPEHGAWLLPSSSLRIQQNFDWNLMDYLVCDQAKKSGFWSYSQLEIGVFSNRLASPKWETDLENNVFSRPSLSQNSIKDSLSNLDKFLCLAANW